MRKKITIELEIELQYWYNKENNSQNWSPNVNVIFKMKETWFKWTFFFLIKKLFSNLEKLLIKTHTPIEDERGGKEVDKLFSYKKLAFSIQLKDD